MALWSTDCLYGGVSGLVLVKTVSSDSPKFAGLCDVQVSEHNGVKKQTQQRRQYKSVPRKPKHKNQDVNLQLSFSLTTLRAVSSLVSAPFIPSVHHDAAR